MRSIDIVRAAQAFKRDGHIDATVELLLKASTGGHNAERAVQSILPTERCETTHVPNSIVEEVVLPTDMVHWLHSANPTKFVQRFGVDAGG